MTRYPDITIQIGNFSGFRDKIVGKGRIQTTIESLLKYCPKVPDTPVLLMDNESGDGSQDYLFSLPFGTKITVPRVIKNKGWEATTRNNMDLLEKAIEATETKYFWRIENDSYFFNSHPFVEKAIEVLQTNLDIHIIHLRKWAPMDAIDCPGVGRNLNRIAEVRTSYSGFEFYIIEKKKKDHIWIPTGDDLGKNFVPDERGGYGMCPLGESVVGAVRLRKDGTYERLLTEKWASYTSHGWIARTADIKYLIDGYKPLGESEMSDAFKKHFRAAKLDEDAFVQFGWRLRNKNWTEEQALWAFRWAQENNHASCKDYGIFVNAK